VSFHAVFPCVILSAKLPRIFSALRSGGQFGRGAISLGLTMLALNSAKPRLSFAPNLFGEILQRDASPMKQARWMFATIVISLAGCGTMGLQTSTMRLSAGDLPQCVEAAVAEVPGVSIDHAHSTDQSFVLTTSLQSGSRGPFAYITRHEDVADMAVVQVRFGAWATREPEWERERISPLLKALTTSLERHCTL